jgi:hypothetical protein
MAAHAMGYRVSRAAFYSHCFFPISAGRESFARGRKAVPGYRRLLRLFGI